MYPQESIDVHDDKGNVLITIDLNRSLWISIDISGSQSISIHICRHPNQWAFIHGHPKIFIDGHVYPWMTMAFPLKSMRLHTCKSISMELCQTHFRQFYCFSLSETRFQKPKPHGLETLTLMDLRV